MDNTAASITCSPVEATFLASLLGADMLLGIQDPFLGWLTEEIEEAWEQTRQALADRRFIEVQPDGGIVMDIAVAALVGTWAFPEASFLLTFTPADGTQQRCSFHLTSNLGVEQSQADDATELTALEDAQAVYRRILQVFGLKDQLAAPGSRAALPEASLIEARACAVEGGEAAASRALQKAGLPEETAESLACTLTRAVANGALVALARRTTTWEVGGLGLLEGANGLWCLRSFTRDGENWVEVTPCDAARARQEIRRLMNRVLLESLAEE